MATFTPTLTLSSTDVTSDELSFSVSHGVTVANTTGLQRKTITSTAIGTASGQVTVDTADTFASPNYIYIKNTAAYHASDGFIYGYWSGDADGMVLQIPGQHFAYMPTSGDFTLKLYTSTSGTVVEFMVVGTDA
tara:strand:+ start:257 stop:658 length:402 start_codon:yes stop_codon:yes gene_type:complete